MDNRNVRLKTMPRLASKHEELAWELSEFILDMASSMEIVTINEDKPVNCYQAISEAKLIYDIEEDKIRVWKGRHHSSCKLHYECEYEIDKNLSPQYYYVCWIDRNREEIYYFQRVFISGLVPGNILRLILDLSTEGWNQESLCYTEPSLIKRILSKLRIWKPQKRL